MKRKVVNPDIQKKKRQQAMKKAQNEDLKHELEDEQIVYPKKIPKEHPKTGHK